MLRTHDLTQKNLPTYIFTHLPTYLATQQTCRLVTIETLITIPTIENLNSWQSLLPDNQKWQWTAFAILAMFFILKSFCIFWISRFLRAIWKSFCMATSHQIHMPQICHLFSPLNFKIFRIFARFWHKMLKCWYWTKFPRTKTAVVWVVHFLDGIFIISDRIFYIYDSAFIINIIKTWNHSRIMESARVA